MTKAAHRLSGTNRMWGQIQTKTAGKKGKRSRQILWSGQEEFDKLKHSSSLLLPPPLPRRAGQQTHRFFSATDPRSCAFITNKLTLEENSHTHLVPKRVYGGDVTVFSKKMWNQLSADPPVVWSRKEGREGGGGGWREWINNRAPHQTQNYFITSTHIFYQYTNLYKHRMTRVCNASFTWNTTILYFPSLVYFQEFCSLNKIQQEALFPHPLQVNHLMELCFKTVD